MHHSKNPSTEVRTGLIMIMWETVWGTLERAVANLSGQSDPDGLMSVSFLWLAKQLTSAHSTPNPMPWIQAEARTAVQTLWDAAGYELQQITHSRHLKEIRIVRVLVFESNPLLMNWTPGSNANGSRIIYKPFCSATSLGFAMDPSRKAISFTPKMFAALPSAT